MQFSCSNLLFKLKLLVSIIQKETMFNNQMIKSDTLGVCASALCMVHCIATPFLFLATATTCSQSCCSAAPAWYQWLDYLFVFVSFFAVIQSTKSSNSSWIKYGLWISWVALFFVIINANYFQWIYLSQNTKFIPSFSLIGLHIYNLKFCQSAKDSCCT